VTKSDELTEEVEGPRLLRARRNPLVRVRFAGGLSLEGFKRLDIVIGTIRRPTGAPSLCNMMLPY
jgi:hypothetical protein